MRGAKKKLGSNWRPFEEARAYVHNFRLKSGNEWQAWAKSADKPEDIPKCPHHIYRDKGWISWGDWLGTGNIAPGNRNFRPFEEARTFARSLSLKGKDQWLTWSKSEDRPEDIPANPSQAYQNDGWASWGDWLGTGNRRGGWRDYEEARTFVHNLSLKNQGQWRKWSKSDDRPEDIPVNPSQAYKDKGWVSWGDWLGTGNRRDGWRDYEEARTFVHNLSLNSIKQWNAWSKSADKPDDIPANARQVYKNKGWVNWGDWLGTDNIASYHRTFRSFEEARIYTQSLGFKNQAEWRKWTKSQDKPADIPTNPDHIYKNEGWVSWGDWLGTNSIASQHQWLLYLPFEEARSYVHNLHLKNIVEWRVWSKTEDKPDDIPADPPRIYKGKGWVSWGDWLGILTIGTFDRTYRPFEEARTFTHSLELKSKNEWVAWAKSKDKPNDIPTSPSKAYKDKGWISWGDWLGTGYKKGGWRNYREARSFVHALRLKSREKWKVWAKSKDKPDDIPASPSKAYKDKGWIGWGDWLGTGTLAPFNRTYKLFEEARAFVRKLRLKSKDEWVAWTKSEDKPDDKLSRLQVA